MKRHIDKVRGSRTLTRFAEDIGVTRQTLYNAMKGVGEPSAKLLRGLGLTKSYRREAA